MTIPLTTYDADWQAKYEAALAALTEHAALPYDQKLPGEARDLHRHVQACFHAQFRTTGDYARWMSEKIVRAARGEGLDNYRATVIAPDSPVEVTNRIYSRAIERIERMGEADRNSLPIAHPPAGQAFATEPGSDVDRRIEAIDMPIPFAVDADGPKHDTHSYLIERAGKAVNICFFHLDSVGPSAMAIIEKLATQVYQNQFGVEGLLRNEAYRAPESIDFFLYMPPMVEGGERFMKVAMEWGVDTPFKLVRDDSDRIEMSDEMKAFIAANKGLFGNSRKSLERGHLGYMDAKFQNFESVPYILRKHAAVEGLARDPDAPPKPEAGTRPGLRPKPEPGN